MFTFTTGAVTVTSSSAMMHMAKQGDWLNGEDIGFWQNVEIAQNVTEGTDTATAIKSQVTKPTNARLLDAPISSAIDLARYLETVHTGVTTKNFLSAMLVVEYEWGKLVEVSWSALGFAPGGVSYFLLPHDLPCVDLWDLKLDWDSVTVQFEPQ